MGSEFIIIYTNYERRCIVPLGYIFPSYLMLCRQYITIYELLNTSFHCDYLLRGTIYTICISKTERNI